MNTSTVRGNAGGSLAGRTVIVTGAGSGIGRATAELATAAGAHVLATDVKGHEETVASIIEAGGSAEAHFLDVTDAGAWQALVEQVVAAHGRVHGLANVAGIVSDSDSLLSQTEDGWARLIDVDLKGPWLGMRAVLQNMLESGGGKIVNVASTAGLIGMPNTVSYSAAKGGVIAMSRQIAVEFAARNLQVNVVAPGVTETSMLGDITDELRAAVKAATPAGRIGRAEDVATLIVHLLGPTSDFITGQVIPVDGGWTAQ